MAAVGSPEETSLWVQAPYVCSESLLISQVGVDLQEEQLCPSSSPWAGSNRHMSPAFEASVETSSVARKTSRDCLHDAGLEHDCQ